MLTVSVLGEAVAPVGSTGTIHYRLASLPYTSGSLLGFDLDVSSRWVTGPRSRLAVPPRVGAGLVTRLEMRLNIYILTQTPRSERAAFPQAPFCPAQELTLTLLETVCLLLVPACTLPHPASRLGVTGFCLAVQPLGRANTKPS